MFQGYESGRLYHSAVRKTFTSFGDRTRVLLDDSASRFHIFSFIPISSVMSISIHQQGYLSSLSTSQSCMDVIFVSVLRQAENVHLPWSNLSTSSSSSSPLNPSDSLPLSFYLPKSTQATQPLPINYPQRRTKKKIRKRKKKRYHVLPPDQTLPHRHHRRRSGWNLPGNRPLTPHEKKHKQKCPFHIYPLRIPILLHRNWRRNQSRSSSSSNFSLY